MPRLVGRKARDRLLADAGVVFLPIRKTPDAVEKVGFFWLGERCGWDYGH